MFCPPTHQLMSADMLPPTLAAAGPVVIQGLGLVAIVLGIMLWLLGKRLARPACAGVWVILGMLVTGAICKLMGDGGLLPVWLIAGGVIAGAIGWMLYRICLAMALALVLGLVVPAMVHFAQVGMPSSEEISEKVTGEVARAAEDSKSITDDVSDKANQKTEELVDAVKDKTTQAAEKVTDAIKEVVAEATKKIAGKKDDAHAADDVAQHDKKTAQSSKNKNDRGDDDDADEEDDAAGDDLLASAPSADSIMAVLRSVVQGPWEKLSASWQDMSSDSRKSLLGAALIGGLGGFFLGLIFPKLGAAAGSSLLGTLFMAAGCITILTYYNPSVLTHLDNQTSLCLMALGLITLMGIGIQWTLERRRTDN